VRGLIPKEEMFFELFREMGIIILSAAVRLKALMDDYTDVPSALQEIKEIEHQGDLLTHEIIYKLNKSFITPFDREDIHALASALDDILDLIDASAQRFMMYHVEETTIEAKGLAFIIVRCCHTISSALNHFGKRHDDILEQCLELNALETEADKVYREAVCRLFDEEKDPIRLMKWKEIYEIMERTTDKCEDAANILESVVVKNA